MQNCDVAEVTYKRSLRTACTASSLSKFAAACAAAKIVSC